MLRKRLSKLCYTLLFISVLITLPSISAQDGNWTKSTLTSYSSELPTIDGLVDSSWLSLNISSYTYSDGSVVTLRVQHNAQYLNILIITNFLASYNAETISVYLSNANIEDESNFMDKKQITMFNASNEGNETYTTSDYHKIGEDYVLDDSSAIDFTGAAQYSNETDDGFRAYEFQIKLNPSNNTQDVNMALSSTYAIKVGFNTSVNPGEKISEELNIQLGSSIDVEDDDEITGEININTEAYILVVMIVVTVIFIGYGGVVVSSKKKVGDTSILEEDT